MPLPLAPIVVMTAVMTLRSDTKPVKVYVKKPRGTLYWGGAGLDGAYVQPQLHALRAAGIQNVSAGLTNTATKEVGARFGAIVDALRAGTAIRYEDDDEWVISKGMDSSAPQFNMIGYSYGSLLAAQTANYYANQGHIVDHLVLIASPIDQDFLMKLKENKNIKKVVVINLTQYGDPIYAGITQSKLIEAIPTIQRQQNGKEERAILLCPCNSRKPVSLDLTCKEIVRRRATVMRLSKRFFVCAANSLQVLMAVFYCIFCDFLR